MAEILLITETDLREFWSVGKNVPKERINPQILRAQQSDLKPFLGGSLYYDFVTNLSDSKYQELLNGKEYEYNGETVFFGGVKPMLAAYSYSRLKRNSSDFLTRAGNKYKQTDESSDIQNKMIMTKAREADSEGIRLQAEVGLFLDSFRDIYPLWKTEKGVKKASMKISKISRFRGY